MFLKKKSTEKICSLSNLVVYSITSAGIKLPNWKNPIAPKSHSDRLPRRDIYRGVTPLKSETWRARDRYTGATTKTILTF